MLFSGLVLLGAMAAMTGSVEPGRSADPAAARPVVYVCDGAALTRMSWKREHGRMQFVSAQALASGAVASSDGPRCITAAELRKLQRLQAKPVKRPASLASR